ncbi:hypothetical protein Goshw_011043 [Gossypium schwendimanii]|uniref:Uncharacterized protein n=1 Tax=Gossypium schwendimanii TaxID=34291 RepID=A0A7J9KKK8_GOSSC|nr:hypothetical protein [Gossypium schwendimanii]
MASSLPFSATIRPTFKHHNRPQASQIKAQSCRDEGTSNNNVDANLGVLRERIEKIKMKKKLERCYECKLYGWSYGSRYKYKVKREMEISQLFEVVSLGASTLAFTFLTATLCLSLVSLFVHLIYGF